MIPSHALVIVISIIFTFFIQIQCFSSITGRVFRDHKMSHWHNDVMTQTGRKHSMPLNMIDETSLSLIAGAISGSIGVGVAYPLGKFDISWSYYYLLLHYY